MPAGGLGDDQFGDDLAAVARIDVQGVEAGAVPLAGQGRLGAGGRRHGATTIADRHLGDLQGGVERRGVGQLGLADGREDGVVGLAHG
ncbi:hypothetical protein Q3H58_004086 [Pseudomonas psychrotolerans]|nr:hypothetical protein [Pseudomonas psychrotolerans]